MSRPGQFQPGVAANPGGMRKTKPFRDALVLAINRAEGDKVALNRIASALVEKAITGDVAAIKEIADRVDGKVAQPNIHQGDEDGGPINITEVRRIIVDPGHPDSESIPTTVETAPI